MITEAIWGVMTGVLAFVLGLIPDWTVPAWFTTTVSTIADAVGKVYLLDNWVPIAAVGHVVLFCLTCSAVAFGVKAFRMVLSLSTGGGGSAA